MDDLKKDFSMDSLNLDEPPASNLIDISVGEEPSIGPALTTGGRPSLGRSGSESESEHQQSPLKTPTLAAQSSTSYGVSPNLKESFKESFGRSGSQSESEHQQSPVKSSTSAAQSSSSYGVSPNLKAVKNLLMANYSKVSHILHWKNPIETGIIFAVGSSIILALTFFSIISVFAYTCLGVIIGSSSMRAYKAVMKMLNMPPETKLDNLWDQILNINVSISPQSLHDFVDSSLASLNGSLSYIKRVLLVEDKFATLAFGCLLYVLTYVGSWFNGMTLISLTYLALFTLPLVYETNRARIDEYGNIAANHVSSTISLVTNKISSMTSSPPSGTSKKKD